MESEGSCRQSAGPTNRKRIEAAPWDEKAQDAKSNTCTERSDVDAAGISVKVGAHYPGRSAGLPWATGIEGDGTGWQKSAEGIVCAEQRAVQEGWSPSDAQMRGVISKDGGNASSARACALEGRVSAARWDPKGMRRSTGP